MRLSLRCICLLFLISACTKPTELEKEFMCKSETFSGSTENTKDVKNTFTVAIPKHWKTNLFYDEIQSSVYFADTTKQLTDTYLIDITHVSNELKLDKDFIEKFKVSLSNEQLVETTSYELKFQDKDSYYSRASGKKGQFNYEVSNLFIKVNTNNYIHAKAEVYGDSLVNQRFCNAFSLIEKIEYKP